MTLKLWKGNIRIVCHKLPFAFTLSMTIIFHGRRVLFFYVSKNIWPCNYGVMLETHKHRLKFWFRLWHIFLIWRGEINILLGVSHSLLTAFQRFVWYLPVIFWRQLWRERDIKNVMRRETKKEMLKFLILWRASWAHYIILYIYIYIYQLSEEIW